VLVDRAAKCGDGRSGAVQAPLSRRPDRRARRAAQWTAHASDRESLRRQEELALAQLARQRRMQAENVATERQALFPTTGKRSRNAFFPSDQVCHIQHPFFPLLKVAVAEPVDTAEEINVFIDRQIFIKRKFLGHVAEAGPGGGDLQHWGRRR